MARKANRYAKYLKRHYSKEAAKVKREHPNISQQKLIALVAKKIAKKWNKKAHKKLAKHRRSSRRSGRKSARRSSHKRRSSRRRMSGGRGKY